MAKKRKIVRGVEHGNHPSDFYISMNLKEQWGHRHLVLVRSPEPALHYFKNLPEARQFVINNFKAIV